MASRLWPRVVVHKLNSVSACLKVVVSLIIGEIKAGVEYLQSYVMTKGSAYGSVALK